VSLLAVAFPVAAPGMVVYVKVAVGGVKLQLPLYRAPPMVLREFLSTRRWHGAVSAVHPAMMSGFAVTAPVHQ